MIDIEGLLLDSWRFEEERKRRIRNGIDMGVMAEILAINAQRKKDERKAKCDREADISQSTRKE